MGAVKSDSHHGEVLGFPAPCIQYLCHASRSSPSGGLLWLCPPLCCCTLHLPSPIQSPGYWSRLSLAEAYVHDPAGDTADNTAPEAEAYVHDATGDVSDNSFPEAEAYIHDPQGDA